MANPTAAELITHITNSGLTPPGTPEAGLLINDALAWWSRETGYPVFLATALDTPVTKYYDPPGPRQPHLQSRRGGSQTLRLFTGFISISEVRTAVTTDDAVGVLQVAGTDYDLLPYEARETAVDEPYTTIKFRRILWGAPKSISVKGVQGYCTTMKADVSRAILNYASYLFATSELQGIAGSYIRVKDDKAELGQSIELLQKLGSPWLSQANRVMLKHKLMQ